MTLVELLLALALLSSLMIMCLSWTTTATRVLGAEGGASAWRAAAERSLDLLQHFLLVEDASLHPRGSSRVDASSESVDVRTRRVVRGETGAFTVCSTARFRVERRTLVLELLDEERSVSTRALLGTVARFEVRVVDSDDTKTVSALVENDTGEWVERAWSLGTGEFP